MPTTNEMHIIESSNSTWACFQGHSLDYYPRDPQRAEALWRRCSKKLPTSINHSMRIPYNLLLGSLSDIASLEKLHFRLGFAGISTTAPIVTFHFSWKILAHCFKDETCCVKRPTSTGNFRRKVVFIGTKSFLSYQVTSLHTASIFHEFPPFISNIHNPYGNQMLRKMTNVSLMMPN